MTKKIGLVLALTTMIGLAACNTVNGDVKSAGTAISSASGEDKK